ncbi:YbaB/EbfC family nucleoid-associated protein [Spirillospora sp. NPDC029432]|uniref:YbaB/EbfC family nucleoid-associated protein n=1 Tax=Spirillospora sp. NPDC029432 TaxID=3154599 RepID=UPI0034567DC1
MKELQDVLGFDPERLADDADRFIAGLREMYEAETALTARAESPDGRVAVECSRTEGLRALHLDPRAMRMGAGELAELIVELTGRAQREIEFAGRERLAGFLGADNSLIGEREAIGRGLRDATGAMERNLADATERLERLRSLLLR